MTTTDTDVSTRHPMVPAEPAAPADADRRPLVAARWLALGAALLLVTFVVGAAFVPVPYVALRPGQVRGVSEHVLVGGATTHPPEQSIAFTTVSIGQATLLEAFVGWLDDDVDVRPEQAIRGGRSASENRIYNAQLMDSSKLVSIAVALRHLGEDVTIRTSGTIVRQIGEGSPAEGALEVDDVILSVDGEPVDEAGRIRELLQVGGPGEPHVLVVERPAGSTSTVEVTLPTVAAPDDPERAIIGIVPEDRIVDYELPFDVTIETSEVGGPSAGLAFTLAVIDVLTAGELTGGHRVAATGTITLDGAVGPIGGPAQKGVTVRNAGYEVFLVPSTEADEVRAAVGDDLRVVPVDTLAEALEALASLGGNAGSLVR